jgi:hypothetical protein
MREYPLCFVHSGLDHDLILAMLAWPARSMDGRLREGCRPLLPSTESRTLYLSLGYSIMIDAKQTHRAGSRTQLIYARRIRVDIRYAACSSATRTLRERLLVGAVFKIRPVEASFAAMT